MAPISHGNFSIYIFNDILGLFGSEVKTGERRGVVGKFIVSDIKACL